MEKRYIGVDLGGTNIKVGVVDPAGKLLYKTERPTRAEEGTEAVIRRFPDARFIGLCDMPAGLQWAIARLLRVNLVQTGLLVHGEVTANVEFRHWPFASPDCQRQDYADTIRLRVADVQPPRR